MPILKTKIFNKLIELNYEEKDRLKLLNLIESLNNRLKKYEILNGKVNDSKILILIALELEDKLSDVISNKNQQNLNIKEKNSESFSLEIIKYKDKLIELENIINSKKNEEQDISQALDTIQKEVDSLNNLIIKNYEE